MKKKRFQKIYIEIINRCNLSCSFCPTSDRPARMMSVDDRLHLPSCKRRTADAPMAWRYFGHRPSKRIKS